MDFLELAKQRYSERYFESRPVEQEKLDRMGEGYWTSGGHYICVWKYDGDYIYANDPASSKRTKQKITDFNKERKALFCFWG